MFVSTAQQSSTAAQVTLAWDASTDPNVTGYNLYYGGASQQYTNMLSAGLTNSMVVGNLTSGATYYFAATAMNSAGLESLFSAEVSCLVGGTNGCVISLGNLAQVYDGTPKAVSVSTSPAGLTVALTYNGLTTAPSAAGNYQVIASVTSLGYSGSATNTLTISKAAAALQISGLTRTYDGASKAVTASSTPGGLAMSITYNGSSLAPVNAGSYQVVASIADPNYFGSATNTLVITKAGASVQFSGLAQTYDGTGKTVAVSTVPAGLALSTTYNGSSAAPVNAGSYQVIATIIDANYTGNATNTLLLAKAVAILQLANLAQTYDGMPKGVTATSSPPDATINLTYNGASSPPVNAGSYQVIATISDQNCSGGCTNTLVIAKANAAVQLANLAQTYDGAPKVVATTTTPAGLSLGILYNGSASVPVNAGSYQVTATVSDANYTGSAAGTLAISKAAGTVQLTNLNQTYNGNAKVVSAGTTPAGLAVTLTYNGSVAAPTNSGSYQVQANINDANYGGTAGAVLVIAKAAGQVQLANLTQTYSGTPKTVTATTLPGGLAVLITYNGQTQPPTRAGSYTVVGTITNLNYAGAATNTLTITKAKGRTTPGTTALTSGAQALLVKSAAPVPQFVLNWPPTDNPVTILHSSDLKTWITLTNVPGPNGSLTIFQQQFQPEFFKATRTDPSTTNVVPLQILRP